MDDRARQYCVQQLASTGWVLINPGWAHRLRPDIFNNHQQAVCVPSCASWLMQSGADRYLVVFEDGTEAVCFSRHPLHLAQRIELITGGRVRVVNPANQAAPQAEPAKPLGAAEREHRAKYESLQKLAAKEPPAHDCAERREILNARRELGLEAQP